MIPYWLLFLFPVLAVLSPCKADSELRKAILVTYALFATLIVGFRYQVGGDWGAYLGHLDSTVGISLIDAMALQDPGYMAINWFSTQLGLGMAGVNLTCGALFMLGLARFCFKQPLPWLGLAIAAPYLLVVVAMGDTRQSVALGFVFWALSEWKPGHYGRYSFLILIAALFHKSAVVMFPFLLFMDRQRLWLKFLLGIPLFLVVTFFLWMQSFQSQWENYVEDQMQSEGGFIRLAMNLLPALIFFIFYKRFRQFTDYNLWWIVSGLSLVFLVLEPLASTVVDRLALYFSPIQVAVFSRLPALIRDQNSRTLVVVFIVTLYASVLWVWLNFATHREFWVPYRWAIQ